MASQAWQHAYANTNGIRMHYVTQGQGFPVVLCHGFPELWYSWRYQIPALAAAGLRAIAPDLRGYGETDKPTSLEAYDIHHLVGDIVGLLDALGQEKAVVVGHDWGGIIVWQMALMHPERVERVVSLNTPFVPHTPVRPTEFFASVPDRRFDYILFFQEPGRAEAVIGADLKGWLERIIRAGAADPAFLTDADLDVYYQAFQSGGMTGPLNYYRNFDHNWETTAHLAGRKVRCPSLMICAEKDPILRPEMAEGMEVHVPDLRKELVRNCGHWTQQERPEEVNALLVDFLRPLQS